MGATVDFFVLFSSVALTVDWIMQVGSWGASEGGEGILWVVCCCVSGMGGCLCVGRNGFFFSYDVVVL